MEALSDHASVRYQLTSPLASHRVNWACACSPAGQSSRLAQCKFHVRGNGKPKATVRLGPELDLMVLLVTAVGPTTFVGSFDGVFEVNCVCDQHVTNRPRWLPELTGGYNQTYLM